MERRFSRNLERLTAAIAFAALVISDAMLLLTPMGGWHHRIRALRRDPDQR